MKKNSLKAALILSLILSHSLVYSQTGFAPMNIINDESVEGIRRAGAIHTADLDNDGDDDILVTAQDGGEILWYENDGQANFSDRKLIASGLSEPKPLTTSDIDMDGYLDIVCGDVSDGSVFWFKNNTNGTFGSIQFISLLSSYLQDVNAVDVDGDGDMDVIHSGNGNISWNSNDGSGNFGTTQTIVTSSFTFYDVATNDVDGDGDVDIVYNDSDTHYLYWKANDGNGNFGSEQIIASGVFFTLTIALEDIDGDGDNDIIFSDSDGDNHRVSWFENMSSGIFGSEQLITTDATQLQAIGIEDMDGDGDLDVVFPTGIDYQLVWYENDGNENFTNEVVINDFSNASKVIAASDLDNDGDIDVISGTPFSSNNNTLFFILNDGTGNFGIPNLLNNDVGRLNLLKNADLDNDGDLDIVICNSNHDRIAWFENDGQGNFGSMNTITTIANHVQEFDVVDMDSDGDLDVVYLRNEPIELAWYENDGTGNFISQNVIFSTPSMNISYNSRIEGVDIDSDGDNDILLYWYNAGAITFSSFINGGSGTFGTENVISNNQNEIRNNFKVLDFDNDGDFDIISLGQIFRWFKNDGLGSFTSETINTSNSTIPEYYEFVDMDGDNDLDLFKLTNVFLYSDEIFLDWMENDGNNNFTNTISIDYLLDEYSNISGVADLDGDNDMDIINSLGNDGSLNWYENDGLGNFGSQQIIDVGNVFMGRLSIADLDGDNDNDIIGSGSESGTGKLFWLSNLFRSPSVSGITYWDVNGNGNYDSNDIPIDIQTTITPDEITSVNAIVGSYQHYLEDGVYDLTFIPNNQWALNSDSSSYYINISNSASYDDLNFGFIPTDTIADMVGSMVTNLPVCDLIVPLYVTWENKGTTVLTGDITIDIDSWIDSIDFQSNLPDVVLGSNEFQWNFTNLNPGQSITKIINIQIPGVIDGFSLGDSIHISMDMDYEAMNTPMPITGVETYNYAHEILCSYDPNDKQVTPDRSGDENLTLFEESLTYTIRFQNTGNYYATDVVIRDTLDDNLDPSTLRMLGSSHSDILQVTLEENKYLTFSFENIMLPDSTLDLQGSQGFLTYIIDPYEGLSVGEVIENTAYIYFDFNPAIVTNTTINTMTDMLVGADDLIGENFNFNILPNPTRNNFEIYLEGNNELYSVSILDMFAREVYTNKIQNYLSVDSNKWANGIYIITIYDVNKKVLGTRKIVKIK